MNLYSSRITGFGSKWSAIAVRILQPRSKYKKRNVITVDFELKVLYMQIIPTTLIRLLVLNH